MFRLYYNRSDDYPFIWSFDTGEQIDERLVTSYRGGKIVGCGFDPEADSRVSPRAWIIIEADVAYIDTEGVVHFE